jgi:hypothetical protein
LLRLSRWTPDFNPFNQKQTHSQVWVRFHYLPLDYWQPRILFEIAGAIGTPISIDENTKNHSFGHYARVLIDIDMAGIFPDSLLVEREKFAFDIEIEYENPPYFCFICNSIGHSSDHCKKDPANKIAREIVATKTNPAKKIKHDFVPKRHVNIVQSCSSKAVANEDPLIVDIIRSKEVETSVLVGDVLNIEEELSLNTHTQNTQSADVLNPNVAHDLAILKQYWEGKDTGDIGHRVYSDEEEREAAINFLKNRAVTSEEPFTVVVSKAKKKNMQKGFQVHNTRSRGRHPD